MCRNLGLLLDPHADRLASESNVGDNTMTAMFRGKIALLFLGSCCLLVAEVEAGWINEIHYDNDGADTGEFVEVVLASGEVIGDFSLEFYNGNGGATYSTGTSADPGAVVNGYSIFSFLVAPIQNGPDGVALLLNGALVPGQFLSYEGKLAGI